MLRAVRFSDVSPGDEFGDSATITEWHILTASAVFYDAGPNHVNKDHAVTNRFGGVIAPGFLTTGMMMGVAGRYFGWSIEAFLDTSVKFLGPVHTDVTVDILWRVESTVAKEAFGGGIVDMTGWCWTNDGTPSGTLAVEMSAKLALNDRTAPQLRTSPVPARRPGA